MTNLSTPGSREGGTEASSDGPPRSAWVFNNRHLRFIFVGFLFSFVIREIALVAYQLVAAPNTLSHLPGMTHLVIALFATTMSWVYWARNINESSAPLDSAFSSQFLLLLVDLALVVLYFFLASAAERPLPESGLPGVASAVPESTILALVYLLYVFWDVFHDIVEKRGEESLWRREVAKATLVRTFASLVCLAFAVLVVIIAILGNVDSPLGVVLLNGAEFANLWLFRSLKLVELRWEERLDPVFRQPGKSFRNQGTMRAFGVAAFILYWVLLVSALASS